MVKIQMFQSSKEYDILYIDKKILAITIILTVTKKNWRANVYVYVSV
jgi:hypothetical protein